MRSAAANTIFFMGYPCLKNVLRSGASSPAIRLTLGWADMHSFISPGARSAARGATRVLGLAAERVGVPGDYECRALEAGIRECLAEFLHCRHRARSDVGRIVVELNIEIDLRLGRWDLRDFLALAERERPGVPVAQRRDETDFLGLDRGIDLRSGRQAARQRLRLQRIEDLICGNVVVAGNGKARRHRQRGTERNRRSCGKSVKAGHGLDPRRYV